MPEIAAVCLRCTNWPSRGLMVDDEFADAVDLEHQRTPHVDPLADLRARRHQHKAPR